MTIPLRILFVEDSPDDAQLIMLQLEREGLDAEFQRVDTEAAFLAALALTPDLILSDYSLPKFNGLRALHLLKERGVDIPFILISGTVGEELAVDAIKQGADDYLMKDRPARLGTAIEHALEQKRLREEKRRADESLRESEARFRTIFDGVQDGILVESLDGRILEVNDRACEMHGYTRAEFLTKTVADLVPQGRAILMANDILPSHSMETVNRRANGETFPIEISGRLQTINGEEVLLVVIRDITERKRSEQALERYVERLNALHSIDLSISGSVDLRTNLDILLNYVVSLLHVDAADILLANPRVQVFEFAAGRGFRTHAIQRASVPFGKSLAGTAALQRQAVRFSGQLEARADKGFVSMWNDEGFTSYVGVPLFAKGQLKGVLEIYHRSQIESEQQWNDFLEALASQAAIAIDSSQMFIGLQQSNTELILAYDATIEGWSRAMDLRDKETEGHTQRVTDLTLQLAQRMKIPDEQLAHYRRGALLHDIGKMGVPDGILHKEGPLTDEEWVIMRQHPTFARDMLASIRYLRDAALDIPYCHHEKWDGTGYPRGLKGGQIPLAARIFAVVDVWDALTSDRPYRAAWTKEKTIAYIREQAGMHFDPEIAEAFLRLVENE